MSEEDPTSEHPSTVVTLRYVWERYIKSRDQSKHTPLCRYDFNKIKLKKDQYKNFGGKFDIYRYFFTEYFLPEIIRYVPMSKRHSAEIALESVLDSMRKIPEADFFQVEIVKGETLYYNRKGKYKNIPLKLPVNNKACIYEQIRNVWIYNDTYIIGKIRVPRVEYPEYKYVPEKNGMLAKINKGIKGTLDSILGPERPTVEVHLNGKRGEVIDDSIYYKWRELSSLNEFGKKVYGIKSDLPGIQYHQMVFRCEGIMYDYPTLIQMCKKGSKRSCTGDKSLRMIYDFMIIHRENHQ